MICVCVCLFSFTINVDFQTDTKSTHEKDSPDLHTEDTQQELGSVLQNKVKSV